MLLIRSPRNARLVLVSLLAVTSACKPGASDQPHASPSPQAAAGAASGAAAPDGGASGSGKHLSLAALVPSPEPSIVMPKMPTPIAGRFVFYDDFEKPNTKWKTSRGKDGVAWFRIESKSCGGLYTMVLGKQDNSEFKGVATTAYMTTSAPVDLKGTKAPQLQYDLKGMTRPFETIGVHVEARRPGGAWKAIGAPAVARYPTVVTFTADLTEFAGGPMEMRFVGDVKAEDRPNKGMFLDDIHVVEHN